MEKKGKLKVKNETAADAKTPPVPWNLSDDDKEFLRSCNISPQ